MNHKYYNIPSIKQVTPPASEPVTVQDVKNFLRIDTVFEDDLLSKIITSSRILIEEYTKRSLITQHWRISFDDFVPRNMRLVRGPIISIDTITLVQANNSTQTITSEAYQLSASKEYILFESMVAGKQVVIEYTTGYGNAAAVPDPIKLAIMALCSRIYERKNEAFKIDDNVRSLIDAYRNYEI